MGKVLEADSDKPEAAPDCSHHWVIESPNGPTSWGMCKYCGAKREFQNYLPVSSWEEDRSASGKPSDPPVNGKLKVNENTH
jgi:hypothetical protein